MALIGLVYLTPMAALLMQSVTDPVFGVHHYARILTQPGYLWTIARTLGISGLATILALMIGYPVAYVIATSDRAWLRSALLICVILPNLTSILIRSFAWQVLLGRVGPINQSLQALGLPPQDLLFNAVAVIIGLTHFLLPLMILPLVSVMRGIDPALLRAGASLGAGPSIGFLRIFVPASLPGIRVGSLLCFIYGLGAFVVPALLGGSSGRMLGVLIQSAIESQADYGLAAAAAVLLAAIVGGFFILVSGPAPGRLAAFATPAAASGLRAPSPRSHAFQMVIRLLEPAARAIDRSGLSKRRWVVEALAAVIGLLILLPQMIAVPISFSSAPALVFPPPDWSTRWYVGFFTEQWMRPLAISLGIALAVATVTVLLGTLSALGIERGLSARAATVANLVLMLPLLFPTVVAAAAFYIAFAEIRLTDSVLGILLAHVTIALPFVHAIVAANLRTLNPSFERAAASLGAGTWAQLRRILLPLLANGIAVGAFFAFLTSFDEASISVFLSGIHVKTLPRRMYEALSVESDPTIGVIAVLSMTVALILITIHAAIRRRRRAPRESAHD